MRTSRISQLAPAGGRKNTSVESVASERSVEVVSVHSSETDPQRYHMTEFARKFFREAVLRLSL